MTAAAPAAELSQLTAPNLTVKAANGVTYAHRRFGASNDRCPPLLFLQHFRGNLDNWDPLLVDGIAADREVILLDNTGAADLRGRRARVLVPVPAAVRPARERVPVGGVGTRRPRRRAGSPGPPRSQSQIRPGSRSPISCSNHLLPSGSRNDA
jgi:hypothetical protein